MEPDGKELKKLIISIKMQTAIVENNERHWINEHRAVATNMIKG